MAEVEIPRNHACERAWERYGILLTIAGLREVERRLACGEGLVISREQDTGEEVRVIRIAEQLVTVAVIPISGTVKSFLPPPTKRSLPRDRSRLR